jgi:aldose 1-epimerase
MSIEKNFYGKIEDGREASIFKLNNSKGMTVEITDFGGAILSIIMPDKNGNLADICLGYDKLEDYIKDGPHFGAIIGRNSNRLEGSVVEIDGKEYRVTANEGENQLHGGIKGFDKKLWSAKAYSKGGKDSIELTYRSVDKEEGYPGNLDVKVTYTLTEENELVMDYYAVTDKDTIVNLTNHAYFNLAGHSSGDVLKHRVMIAADQFTVNDRNSIPTGEIREVSGTPMDFREFVEVGSGIESEYDQLDYGNGYDHNWIINRENNGLKLAATAIDDYSGRCLEVFTTKPGIQFYSGNYLDQAGIGKDGVKYERRSGLCLETQFYPNGNKHKHFPSSILRVGEEYKHTTVYKFSVVNK